MNSIVGWEEATTSAKRKLNMNKDILKGKWLEIRGRVKKSDKKWRRKCIRKY
jgi:hypothetical protein